MDRRSFLVASGAVVAMSAAAGLEFQTRWPFGNSSSTVRRYGDIVLRRARASNGPNVLFLAIDDLNDWVGFLANHPGTRTPNLDALAARSVVFEHAYCAAPICLAARTAAMYGVAPYHSGVYDQSDASKARYDQFQRVTPSLIDDLWAAGYDVIGAGKVFNGSERRRWTQYRATAFYAPGADRKTASSNRFDPNWVSPYDGTRIGRGERFTFNMIDFGPSGRRPEDEPDGASTQWVKDRLHADHARPFFLAEGFVEPHEPWRVPQRFFDMHPLDSVVVPPLPPGDVDDLPAFAREQFIDRIGIFARLRRAGLWQRAVQAYQAAISFVDDRIGVLMNELASSPYADDTVVVVWSDNAYHLGEKLQMEKTTLWERATHVPFLLYGPRQLGAPQRVADPVSTLDIRATVADLCGAPMHGHDLDTRSLLPILAAPDTPAQRPVIMSYQAGNHAVRYKQWRLIKYRTGDLELYDHSVDPNEYTNLAAVRGHAKTIAELSAFLPARG